MPRPIAPEEFPRLFGLEAGAFRAAYLRADGSEPVPNCPEWTTDGLCAHLCRIFHRANEQIRSGSLSPVEIVAYQTPQDRSQLVVDLDRLIAALREAFAGLDPEVEIWTYVGVAPAVFWVRRMTHETMVHTFDLEAVHPPEHSPEEELVADGIDEFLTVQLERKLPNQVVTGLEGRMALRATDSGDRWVLGFTPSSLVRLDPSAAADTELTGEARDLLKFLWRRVSPYSLEHTGDANLIAAYQEGLRL